jgi:hypothetical protein
MCTSASAFPNVDHGPLRRCPSEEIAGLSSLWTDLDLKSAAHAKLLPATIPEALTILPPSMPPSIIIGTGNGIHPWWLLKEPQIFDTDEERKDAARLVARWHSLLRLNAAARGWSYDRLSDLARVLRIPGTLNHKDPAHPKEVTVLSITDHRYNLSDFEEFLDEAGVPDQEAQEKAARDWADRFADTPLAVDTNARIPQEMLDAWMRDDLRFRNTWNRLRHDLKDQSQSGYDLALACFGVDAGLPEQRIVDLIVHHRSLFARSQRTRVDYFQRTIAKANQRTGGEGSRNAGVFGALATPAPPPTTGPAAPEGAPVAPEEQPAPKPTTPDPDRAKAILCEQISKVLGIGVVRIVKVTGKEPQYRMELAGGEKIEFSNVGKLISQESVRLAIAATVGRIIPKITKWDRLAQAMLDACIVEAGTEEMEWEGAARMYIQHYLSETGFIQSHRRPAGAGAAQAHGHRRQDHHLRLRYPGLRQQDDVPEPVRQGHRRHAGGAGSKEHASPRPGVQGAVPVGLAAGRVRPAGVLGEGGVRQCHRMNRTLQAASRRSAAGIMPSRRSTGFSARREPAKQPT